MGAIFLWPFVSRIGIEDVNELLRKIILASKKV
jgi:hypothetical protein